MHRVSGAGVPLHPLPWPCAPDTQCDCTEWLHPSCLRPQLRTSRASSAGGWAAPVAWQKMGVPLRACTRGQRPLEAPTAPVTLARVSGASSPGRDPGRLGRKASSSSRFRSLRCPLGRASYCYLASLLLLPVSVRTVCGQGLGPPNCCWSCLTAARPAPADFCTTGATGLRRQPSHNSSGCWKFSTGAQGWGRV